MNLDASLGEPLELEQMTLVRCLDEWAARSPRRKLYSFLDGRGLETDFYDYAAFAERTNYLAQYLHLELGIGQGDRILLAYPPGLESIAAFFACARRGAIAVPVPPPSQRDYRAGLARMTFIAGDCGARVALTNHVVQREMQEDRNRPQSSENGSAGNSVKWIATDNLKGCPSGKVRDTPSETLFLQYTSGSTSTPKGVMVSHQNVIHNGLATLGQAASGKIGVSWLPQYHDMGLIGYYLYPVVVGGSTYGFSAVDFLRRPALWLQTISRVRATYSSSPNFGFEYCLRDDKLSDSELEGVDLSSLEWLMNAAEPVSADTYDRFFQRFAPHGLRRTAHVVAYGLAENTLAVSHHGRRSLSIDRRSLSNGTLSIVEHEDESSTRVRTVSCGAPLEGTDVRIVDPANRTARSRGEIGEIWIAGPSTCRGYWDRPELSRETFNNTIANLAGNGDIYLRTGDLGFIDGGELFVCGRLKDLIIIRGVNYHPQDIERVVESSSPKIRPGGVVAFAGNEQQESIVVVIEVRSAGDLPEPQDIVDALRTNGIVGPYTLVLVRAKTVAHTTSGKLARGLTRQRWLEGLLSDLLTFRSSSLGAVRNTTATLRDRFSELLEPYSVRGREHLSLEEIGIDSLDLVMVVDEFEQILANRDARNLEGEVDGRLLQRLTVNQLFSLLDLMEEGNDNASALRPILTHLKDEQEASERESMQRDSRLGLVQIGRPSGPDDVIENLLFTGPTGFFGPFLLAGLLQKTPYTYYALTRAHSPEYGRERIRDALREARLNWPSLERDLDSRVQVLCGDVSKRNLGLDAGQWNSLAGSVQAIVHNAALVNYSMNYSALKPHNVDGTRELLRLAMSGVQKPFHYISSTIIFGWTQEERLFETDNNDDMLNLDFGYSQSKWVAERLVFEAARHGLPVQTYRPSFVSASRGGIASPADITIRLLAFMINHGIGVNARNQISFLPADIAADNIATIIGKADSVKMRVPPGSLQPTLHVTVDDFYSIIDLTRVITQEHGFPFVYYDIPEFVSELKRRCTKDDPLYPLLDFVTRSYLKIARMERKRYDNRHYREARKASGGRPDSTLSETAAYLMRYLSESGLLRQPNTQAAVVAQAVGA